MAMAPNIDPSSDAYLVQRYDDLYNASAEFRSRLHNVVTRRALKLVANPSPGDAYWDPASNTITVHRQRSAGGNKTDIQLRDDLFFEMHNAKKSVAFEALDGSTGYNAASITNDVKKKAAYAVATEWTEWINVAESTILVYIVNAQAGVALLSAPPEFRAQFDAGPDSWLKFGNYLRMQVNTNHTFSYDPAATGAAWRGYDVLRVVASTGRNNSDLEIYTNEIAPNPPKQPSINTRGNPFDWSLIKGIQLS
jgi:hypothetical protein